MALPPASRVLCRSLILWGWGHLAVGDRRGWLLLIVQPLAVVGVGAFAVLLIDGTRWMLVLPALLLLLAVWLGQALGAYRRAIELGAGAGGELQIAAFLPLAVTVVTAFWLVGGMDGAPDTTLRRYVSAWEENRADAAAALFATPVSPSDLAAAWAVQTALLQDRVNAAADQFGPLSGIDPDQPFNSLLFDELPSASPDTDVVQVEIVRRQRVATVLLGFIPTATQQTVVVEQLGTISLRALPSEPPPWMPPIRTGARVWRIDSVQLAATP